MSSQKRIMWRDKVDGKLYELGPGDKPKLVIEERLFGSWEKAQEVLRPRFDTISAADLQKMTNADFDRIEAAEVCRENEKADLLEALEHAVAFIDKYYNKDTGLHYNLAFAQSVIAKAKGVT